ncbi:lysine--tRNA ligase, partial [SAR202 cluster bacterium AD-802-E10_MRT_200m]|nr:lysine--tRNA ligase [SAR202 cluster bacterium AD-802-E10_MRT_200m]
MADQGEGQLTIYQVRHRKLQRLRAAGINPFPSSYVKTHTNREASILWSTQKQIHEREAQLEPISVGGRIVAIRTMGKATFIDLQDGSGRLQTLLRQNVLKEAYQLVNELDVGDFLGVTGDLFETRTGEVTVNAQTLSILSKALHPPPEKWHGLRDIEQRYRHREVDLFSNEEVRQRFMLRSDLVYGIREFLRNRGFMEVETPILLPVAAGAMATPFVTHHNALDRTLYLRIATELHLKRCIIGGLDRVFEIGRLFRNEGLDFRHNPEFTSLESYQAYCDYVEVMEMVEEMVAHLALNLLGTTDIPWKDQVIHVKPPWQRKSVKSAILEYSGIDIEQFPDAMSLAQRMRDIGLEVTQEVSWGRLVDKLLGDTVEPNQTQPIF